MIRVPFDYAELRRRLSSANRGRRRALGRIPLGRMLGRMLGRIYIARESHNTAAQSGQTLLILAAWEFKRKQA